MTEPPPTVGRCVELIGDLTGGVGPSSGFVHSMLARCAAAVRPTVTLIKTLITSASVVGFDETTLRVGPAGHKRYVLSASTEDYTAFHLGGRDLASLKILRDRGSRLREGHDDPALGHRKLVDLPVVERAMLQVVSDVFEVKMLIESGTRTAGACFRRVAVCVCGSV